VPLQDLIGSEKLGIQLNTAVKYAKVGPWQSSVARTLGPVMAQPVTLGKAKPCNGPWQSSAVSPSKGKARQPTTMLRADWPSKSKT
jgi:hypothetical protein